MSRTLLLPLFLLSLAVISACSPTKVTRGYHLVADKVAQIETGVTSREEVAEILGSPSTVSTFQEYSDTWYYISKQTERYTDLSESTVSQQAVAISFNVQGLVNAVTSYRLADARDITLSSRNTPTQGDKLGLFEQLSQNLLQGLSPGG